MPEPFRHRLRVRWSECDLQGVVFYPQYLAYLDHTVTELWRAAVGPYTEMIPEHGVDMVVAEAGMRYRDSARFDDELEISASVTRLGESSITTEFKIERVADAALLTEGELRHVFVDPRTTPRARCPSACTPGSSASRLPDDPLARGVAAGALETDCRAALRLGRGDQRGPLPTVAHKPEGDLILGDIAREDASVDHRDLKDLARPERRLDRASR